MNMKSIQACAVNMSNNAKDCNGKGHCAWIVPHLLNPLRFIKTPLYLEGVRTLSNVLDSNLGQSNVEFVEKLFQ